MNELIDEMLESCDPSLYYDFLRMLNDFDDENEN